MALGAFVVWRKCTMPGAFWPQPDCEAFRPEGGRKKSLNYWILVLVMVGNETRGVS